MKRQFAAHLALILAALLCLGAEKKVKEFTGKVVGVSDGDTITVLVGKAQKKVRLMGIDAPESTQPYGSAAKQALSEAVFGQQVVVKWKEKDDYDRTLGFVFLNGKQINASMIEAGYAWHYKQYSQDPSLAALENAARAAKRGLWADQQQPIPPWDYRHHQAALKGAQRTGS
jgi:micrococcal nuclease